MDSKKGKITFCTILLFGLAIVLFFQLSFGQNAGQKKPRWMELGDRVEAADIDPSQYPFFTKWLDEFGKTPLDYALQKCQEHQVVIFGEFHGVKDYVDFFLRLIPEAYHRAGMRYVILEVCRFEDNGKITKLIEGETFDRKLALEIARNGPWADWNSKEYWDIFEVVWKLNKSLPADAEHMKVIGMDVSADMPFNWLYQNKKLEDPKLLEKAKAEQLLLAERDVLMAAAVEETVIRNKSKGMVWVGGYHAFTRYSLPAVNGDGIWVHDWPRLGNLLYQRYRDRIFHISFQGTDDSSPKDIFKKYNGEKPVLSGLIEKIMAERGNRPVGFDLLSSPFANVRDSRSLLFYFQPNVTFADISQGFIFLNAFEKLANCQKIKNYVSDEMFKKYGFYYETRFKKKFKNAQEVNEFLLK